VPKEQNVLFWTQLFYSERKTKSNCNHCLKC